MSKTDVRIVLDSAGIQSILKCADMGAFVDGVTERVKSNAGDGYEVNNRPGRKRYIGEVYAATYKTRVDNSKNNTLLKALHK